MRVRFVPGAGPNTFRFAFPRVCGILGGAWPGPARRRFSGTFVAARASYEGESSGGGEPDFQGLVDLYYGPLYRFAVSLTHTESDAGDLVQETFLTWASKGHQLQDASKAKAWLFTTLHRRFLQNQRRATRFPHLELTEVDAELPSVEPGLVDRLDAQGVVDLLAQVDPQFRAPVALFYLEDYSYNEIAAILEVPLGTVKSRIARGLTQLKLLLRRTESSPPPAGEEMT
jgi:RNA polymerase sigma factor (sigma-70 family)